MYRMIVRRIVRSAFAALSRDELSVLDAMSTDVHHSFPGEGALGGERHTRDDVAAWFHRLHRVLPGLRFPIHGRVSGRGSTRRDRTPAVGAQP